jgi:hypothetical protein
MNCRDHYGSTHFRIDASGRILLIAISQLILIAAGIAYGSFRYLSIRGALRPPVPRTEPVLVPPLHDRPEMVSDAQLTAVLRKVLPRLRGEHPNINHVSHALYLWGCNAVFDDSDCLSGQELRSLLLDHRAFAHAWGTKTKPLLIGDTKSDTLTFRSRTGPASSSQIDQTLANLAVAGTPLDFPVITPVGEMRLKPAFNESLRRFSMNQNEFEWPMISFLYYLPQVREWSTTEGQRINWDLLSERIMRQRLIEGAGRGNLRLHALVLLLRIDADFQLLSPSGRRRINEYFGDVCHRLVQTQHANGYWDGRWSGDEWDGPVTNCDAERQIVADRLMVTGHILEWCALAPAELLPPQKVLIQASKWICQEIEELTPSEVATYYPILAHAGRALSLWRGRFPHEHMKLRIEKAEAAYKSLTTNP